MEIDAFYKLNLNLVSNSCNRKLTTTTEHAEYSSENNARISQATDTVNSRTLSSAVDSQQPQPQRLPPSAATGTSLSCTSSHPADNQDAATVANMVLSQPPLQVRSSYYGDYQKPGFDDSFVNYQSFGSRQHLSQYQNAPQFNTFTNNAKACYNNSYSKYPRTYQFEPKMGMKDVPLWLKSLRLHKYTPLLASMGYDEMMKLDESTLEYMGVTKGARRKIMQSIEKLRERVQLLRTMEKKVDEGNDYRNLVSLITELRGTMNTPIRRFPPPGYNKKNITVAQIEGFDIPAEKLDEENLPGHIIRIVGKVQAILTGPNAPSLSEDCYAWLMQTLDRIAGHEAFTPEQKAHVEAWKKSFKKVCSPSVSRRNMRKPNASVLLSSGSGNNSQGNINGMPVSQAAMDIPRKRSEQNQNRKMNPNGGGYQGQAMQLMQHSRQLRSTTPDQAAVTQNVLNSVFHNFSSEQKAAYCLSFAAAMSKEMFERLFKICFNGNPVHVLNPQHEMVFPLGKQMCGSSNTPYTSPGCYVQQQQQQQQEFNRNGPNFDAFSNRNINSVNRRAAWTPYTGTDVQRSQTLSPGMQSFPEAPCPGFQPNVSFSAPNMNNLPGVPSASSSAFSPTRSTTVQNSNVPYPNSSRSCNHNLNVTVSSRLPHSNSDRGQYKQSSNAMFADMTSFRPNVLETRPQLSSAREDLMPSAWYDVPSTSSLKISPTESLFESISALGAEHSNLRVTEPRKQAKKLCNDESSLFGAALPTRPAAGSPSEQLNSMSSSPRCSPNASERGSGAGSPRGLLVYNFVNEGSSGELDSACRNAALEENH